MLRWPRTSEISARATPTAVAVVRLWTVCQAADRAALARCAADGVAENPCGEEWDSIGWRLYELLFIYMNLMRFRPPDWVLR